MRYGQASQIDHVITVQQQVQIDSSRSPPYTAHTTELLLDIETAAKQNIRRQGCRNADYGVQKVRLPGGTAYGGSAVDRRSRGYRDYRWLSQKPQSFIECIGDIALITAQSDVSVYFNHRLRNEHKILI